ncbi:MAG: hypothetical protein GY952_13345 [Rhodobacteraceae bacterium]|nr:hypothetical protein [Paracoccaceae bacterium]
MALFWRIWLAVCAVNLVVLALFVFLAALQFDSVNTGLLGERLRVLASRTAAPFEATARIGLPLSTVRNADALLERAKQTDGDILDIIVFDQKGVIVHGPDDLVAKPIPPEALSARLNAAGAPWHIAVEKGFFSSIDIPLNDGTSAGGILITYPAHSNVTQIRAMVAEIGLTSMAIFLLAAALSGLLLRLGTRRQIAAFEAVDDAIAGFERGAWRSATDGQAAQPGAGGVENGLRTLLDSSEARYRSSGRALDAALPNAHGGERP